MLRFLTAGDSHGKFINGILDGLPYGIKIDAEYVKKQLERRRTAPGRSARQKLEKDEIEIISGLKGGVTTGAPVSVLIKNAKIFEPAPYSFFTPGHAELAGMLKYSITDASIIKERASARETAVRVALFSFARGFLESLDMEIESAILSAGTRQSPSGVEAAEIIEEYKKRGDSFGGVFEVRAKNVPAGLGGHAQGDLKLQARISKELFSINAVKGVEIGLGFALAGLDSSRLAERPAFLGGIQGGISDGGLLYARCAVRPVPGIKKPLKTTDIKSMKKTEVSSLSSDVTALFAAAVVAENTLAFVLADAVLEKFGGDNFSEIKERIAAWRKKTEKILKKI